MLPSTVLPSEILRGDADNLFEALRKMEGLMEAEVGGDGGEVVVGFEKQGAGVENDFVGAELAGAFFVHQHEAFAKGPVTRLRRGLF